MIMKYVFYALLIITLIYVIVHAGDEGDGNE